MKCMKNSSIFTQIWRKDIYLFFGYYEGRIKFKDGVLFKSCNKIIGEMNYKGNSIGLICRFLCAQIFEKASFERDHA